MRSLANKFAQLASCYISKSHDLVCYALFEDDKEIFAQGAGALAQVESLCRHFTMVLNLCIKGFPDELAEVTGFMKKAAEDAKSKFAEIGEYLATSRLAKLNESIASLERDGSKHAFTVAIASGEAGKVSWDKLNRKVGDTANDYADLGFPKNCGEIEQVAVVVA